MQKFSWLIRRGCPVSPSLSLGLPVVGLEGDLEDPVAQRVTVERLYGHQRLLVIGHRDEAEALALVSLQVTDHLKVNSSVSKVSNLKCLNLLVQK